MDKNVDYINDIYCTLVCKICHLRVIVITEETFEC